MTQLKKIIFSGVIVDSLLFGGLVILLTTNSYILSFVERAVEIGFNPFRIQEWIWILVEL